MQDEKWKKIREEIHMKSEKEKACEAEKNKSLQRFLGNTVKQASLQAQHVAHRPGHSLHSPPLFEHFVGFQRVAE